MSIEIIKPNWPVASHVIAYVSTRKGGVSNGKYSSLNLGAHVGDDLLVVQQNRQLIENRLNFPSEPVWLNQVHGSKVLDLPLEPKVSISADSCFTSQANTVCTIMTADCLPVLVCDKKGSQVAAIHCGWRGIAGGVIENTIEKFSCSMDEIYVWLGPAIGPNSFEVGIDVYNIFVESVDKTASAFIKQKEGNKWLANIYTLAKLKLNSLGIKSIYGGNFDTYSQNDLFFSYRRDKQTGRMASFIWFE